MGDLRDELSARASRAAKAEAAEPGALFAAALGARRGRLPPDTDAFRWVDFELGDVSVDLFGDVAVLSTYRALGPGREAALAEALARARPGTRAVYLKRRPKQARREANEKAALVAPPLPAWGESVERLTCAEAGARFEIRPGNGLSVGLYLDARDARAWVRRHARGRAVLNLFAYTCGFGLAARLGGALRAVNLDASRRVLDWGEANLAQNGFVAERKDFIAGDALEWLPRLAKKGERFGGVVLDPPSFASVGKRRFVASAQYAPLVASAATVVEPGGWLLCCSNLAQWSLFDLERQVKKGAAESGRRARVQQAFGASAVDFPSGKGMKAVALAFE